MEKWPNFFIVGAPKAGTTSLYWYLSQIQGIYMSSIKEPNYFSSRTIPNNSRLRPIRNKEEYLDLFENVKDEKIIGEASPLYLSDPDAPKLIHEIIPNAKILISLRDPVERLFSHYLMYVQFGFLKPSFHQELKNALKNTRNPDILPFRLELGYYSEAIKRYLDVFEPKQVKIIIFEEWIKNPKGTVEEILQFLDSNQEITDFKSEIKNPFDAMPRPGLRFVLKNQTIRKITRFVISRSTGTFLKNKILLKNQPKLEIDQESRLILVKIYRDDVKNLETILGRKLPWPNF